MIVRLYRWLPMVALVLLTLLFFHKLAFTDMILARGDTYSYFYPYWDARNVAMRSGQLPLWTPDIFMGVPLLANPQLGTFYSPNWLTVPFTAPDGVRISIIIHVIWAAIGTFLLFRIVVSKSLLPAMLAAIVFAFSGYLGAHVEQINQLQGLAWLPWLVLLYHRTMHSQYTWRWAFLLAIAWSLQIFSGHTQTVFMSGITLGLYGLVLSWHGEARSDTYKALFSNIGSLVLVAIFASMLAIPQLVPTLELTDMSNRGGGFTVDEATAFSLPPTYLGRALLPSYDGVLFTEYIVYLGVIALGLAINGIMTPSENNRHRWAWITLSGIGLLFALGEFNPLYWQLAHLPGFNLFRVPARWLALYSLGMSMLSGYGLWVLQRRNIQWRKLVIISVPLILLMIMARVLPIRPVDMIVAPAQPTLLTVLLWVIAFATVLGLFMIRKYQWMPTLTLVVVTLELFLASMPMLYNQLTPREVYLGQRFTISQMLAFGDDAIVPPRMLSISGRLFDPGDSGTLQTRYDNLGMDYQAQQTAFTAIKNQEILAPNLGLTWGIPTLDGYGGGILPTIYYSQFTSLLLPEGVERTRDGRIGEWMTIPPACRGACIPNLDLLRLTHTQYLITDKNFDIPYQEVFYDTSLSEFWITVPERPDFVFDEVQVLFTDPFPNSESFQFQDTAYHLARLSWEDFEALFPITDNRILAVSVVDTRTNTFQQLTPAGFERVLSSDIKIYELDNTVHATFLPEFAFIADNVDGHELALEILERSPNTLVLHNAPELAPSRGDITITQYTPTSISMDVNAEAETYLYLADAYYPGWRATVNGQQTAIYRANVMFRAISVPAGESTVIMRFVPTLWYWAIGIGAIVWLAVLLLLGGLFLRKAS